MAMTEEGPFQGDWGDVPVKKRVWLNRTGFELVVSPTSGEVGVKMEQRDGWRIFYRTKVRTGVGVGSWPWSFSPKRRKADFKLTLSTSKKDTTFTYSWEAPT